VNIVDHSFESIKMAPLSGRHYLVVRALVPAMAPVQIQGWVEIG
jgi:hypothetical protein